jgi:branched-chain amino acid transport system permease protein
VLVVLFYVAHIVDSPFGLTVRGIHGTGPDGCFGTPVFARLWWSTVAGRWRRRGSFSAQTNAVVGMDSLSFALSAEALVMLILGGAGDSPALVGPPCSRCCTTAASINPYHWLFVVGAPDAVVLVSPAKAWAWLRRPAGGAR